MSWTKERTDRCFALWIEGKSATEIAATLGRVTRSAVMGKIGRAGLTREDRKHETQRVVALSWSQRRSLDRAATRAAKPVAATASVKTRPVRAADVVPLMVDLTDVGHGCKWPYGEGPFYFCGHDRSGDGPYCKAHRRLSVRRSDTARDKAA